MGLAIIQKEAISAVALPDGKAKTVRIISMSVMIIAAFVIMVRV